MKMVPFFGKPQTSTERAAHDWLVEHLGQEGEPVMKSLAALIERQVEHVLSTPPAKCQTGDQRS